MVSDVLEGGMRVGSCEFASVIVEVSSYNESGTEYRTRTS
jgi:hypothetical protein